MVSSAAYYTKSCNLPRKPKAFWESPQIPPLSRPHSDRITPTVPQGALAALYSVAAFATFTLIFRVPHAIAALCDGNQMSMCAPLMAPPMSRTVPTPYPGTAIRVYYPCLEAEPGDLTASRNAYTTVEPLDETRRWAELTRRVMPLDLIEPRRRRPVRERPFRAGRSVRTLVRPNSSIVYHIPIRQDPLS